MNMSKGNMYNGDQTLSFLVGSQQSNGEPYYPVFLVDINGDGKDDIIQPVFNANNNQTTTFVFYSRGYDNGVYNYSNPPQTLQNNSIYLCGESYYRFADLNCDGKTEMLYTGAVGDTPVLVSFSEKQEHDLVHTFTNGIGKCSVLEYAYCNSPNIGNFGRDGKRVGFPIVSKQREPNGIGGTTETTYTYGYAKFDLARRQMMGFGLIDTYCNGTNTQLEYQYNDDYHHLNLEHFITYYMQRGNDDEGGYMGDSTYWVNSRMDNNHYEVVNELAYQGLAYGRFIPYFSYSSTIDKLKNAQRRSHCWLDSGTGRLVAEVVDHIDYKSLSWVSRDSITYSYVDVALLNGQTAKRISSVQSWNKRNGFSETPSRLTTYTYSNGGLSLVNVSDSDGGVGTSSYEYNRFGLIARETYTPYSMTSRTKFFSYDEKGRFNTRKIDVLEHACFATFDDMTGLITSETDVNGLTTSYEYDDLGRLMRLIRPDRTERHFRYGWNNIPTFSNAVYYITEVEDMRPLTRTYYDVLGRAIHIYKEGRGYDDIVYDKLGLVSKTTYVPYSNPNVIFENKTWHTNTYDNYNRIVSEADPYTDFSYTYYDYNNATMHEAFVRVDDNIRNVYRIKKYDALGRITQSSDVASSVNYSYAYETISNTIRDRITISVGGNATTIVSDIRGNRLSIQDPDAGTVTSTYNALNQLTNRIDANGNQTSYAYDLGGRLVQAAYSNGNESETITYNYDNAEGAGVGQLASVKKNGNNDCVFLYDNLGRISNKTVYDGNTLYSHKYDYNNWGQLQYFTYPDGYVIENVYNSYGELEQIKNNRDHSLVYAADTRNRFRQPLKCRYGNETGVQYTYNSYGLLTGIKNGDIINGNNVNSVPPGDVDYSIDNHYRQLNYTYDSRGFVVSRTDTKVSQTETYNYDNLDRLVSYNVNGIGAASFSYTNSGNIQYNSRVGSYSYGNSKPHAVTGISGNMACPISASQCDVTYNLRNKPSTIAENGYSITLDYDAAGMRRHTYYRQANVNMKSKARISDVHEVELAPGFRRDLDYIYAEGQLVAVHVKNGNADSLYYVMTDHLGSWNKVMDEGKNIVQQTHFDPWGNRMSYTAWNTPQTQISFPFDRGFTGHEHYDRFKIINANARLYDPVIGRFFSPDPFVQVPDFSQSFNRYSYCLNNPVMYNDPTGEVFVIDDIIAAAAIGAIINGFTQIVAGNVNNVGDFFVAAGIGALSGAVGLAIGSGVNAAIAGGSFASGFVGAATVSSTGFIAGAATGAASGFASGFITGTGNSLLAGNGFGQSLQNGLAEGVIGLGTGGLIGGICGGIEAVRDGRDFFSGSYKQYELKPTLIASADNQSIYDPYQIPDNAYLVNMSDNYVYYKPEEESLVGINERVSPGYYTSNPIDGVATELYPDQVYKVVDGMSVYVYKGGYVSHYRNFNTGVLPRIKGAVGQTFKGGWHGASYFRRVGAYDDWKALFNAAKLLGL